MGEAIDIKFEELDFLPEDMNYFNRRARKIAKIVNDDPRLVEVLAKFLLTFINKINFNKRYKDWEKRLIEIEELYSKDNLDVLVSELYNSYNKVCDYHIDKFRGLIFEYIVESHYRNIYTCFSKGCRVIINGIQIKYICEKDERNNRSTIDIAGYSSCESEFYEVKVGPDGFRENVITYLNMLNDAAHKNKISDKITVGCMTLEVKSKLILKLNSTGKDYSGLDVLGRHEVKEILLGEVAYGL